MNPARRSCPDKLVRLNHLMRWTLRAFYWLDESLQNVLEQEGWPGASHTQSMVILAIGEGITRPSDLGRHLGISRQAVHQVIAGLIRKGIVTLRDDPDDKRSKIVCFSPKAVKIRQSAIRAVDAIEREVARRIGDESYRALTDALSKNWGPPIGSEKQVPKAKGTQRRARAAAS